VGNKTAIEWSDSSWNPVSGCTKVSPGCDHCYAEKVAQRFAGTVAYPDGFDVTLWPDRLDQPLRWTRPRKIFVNSMGDLFHDEVPEDFVAQVFAVMAAAPRHTFQLLTKRHARMRSLVSSQDFREKVNSIAMCDYDHDTRGQWPLSNLWLGVSAENQTWADIRIPVLVDTPAAVRFVSAEPLIGPITDIHAETLDWVIVGGESGPGSRPMHVDWARALWQQCAVPRTPFLFKQWGSHDEHGQRMNKHETGRLLDGRTWDGYPPVSGGRAVEPDWRC